MRTWLAALSAVIVTGCLTPYVAEEATGSTGSSSSAASSTTATTGPSPDATSTGDGASTSGRPADLPAHPPGWCDIWNDTCPEDQKCAPVDLDGDGWTDDHRCVPLAPELDGLYETCKVLGTGDDGLDTCGRGLSCRFQHQDFGGGMCVAMCLGSLADPSCADPDARCGITSEHVSYFCYPACDPLDKSTCPAGYACQPDSPERFECDYDTDIQGGKYFAPCIHGQGCDPGFVCISSDLANECPPSQDDTCCLPYCDTTKSNTCPGEGQECLPWYEEGQAPPKYEHVGVCGLP